MGIYTFENAYKKYRIPVTAIIITLALLFTGINRVNAADPEYNICNEYPANPVLNPAERVYYPSIIFNGSSYQMWYDDGSSTLYSTSPDGINWAAGTPVTGLTNGRHAVVVDTGSKYLIWYWDSSQLYSINDLRTAESNDGISWSLDTPLSQVGTTVITGAWPDWNTGSYGPCEVFYNAGGSATIVAPVDAAAVWQNKFVMYYDGTTGGVEDIGVAVSADGQLWEGYNGGAAAVLAHSGGAAWDSDFATFCSVQKIDGTYHMWYSGGQTASNEGIGYAQSSDGLIWTKDTANPMIHKNDGIPWRADRTYTPRVLYDAAGFSGAGENTNIKMWYNGTSGGDYALGYASITVPAPPSPVSVGGAVGQVNKALILAPYLGTLAAGAIIFVLFRLGKKYGFARVNRGK